MPAPTQESIVLPPTSPVMVSLEPAQNAFHSLFLLTRYEQISGLDSWVTETAARLTPQEKHTQQLVMYGLHYAAVPVQNWPSFPAYLDYLDALDPVSLRAKMFDVYARVLPEDKQTDCCFASEPDPVDWQAVLQSADSYLDFLAERFGADHVNRELETEVYSYVIEPTKMRRLIVSHLRDMWTKFLAPEWARVEPMLQESVRAFQQIDLGNMERMEAARFVTGQAMAEEKWAQQLQHVTRIVLSPSAHMGPYLGRIDVADTLWIFFKARTPTRNQANIPDLSRNDILVRLEALADKNRLHILELISEKGEQSSQDIIAALGLSQSAISRHLKQLSTIGYLSEYRCNGAKCYQLNADHVKETLQAISFFLLGS